MTALPSLMVAPNGARRQKSDHPAIPLTLDEIVVCAQECHAAGADGLHLHVRDADGGHLLDAKAYRAAIEAIEDAAPGLAVQITTEAVGKYDPPEQKRVALESGARMVSASVAEICSDGEKDAEDFYATCDQAGIAIQHILYDLGDAEQLARVLPWATLGAPDLQLLFVLGRYAVNQDSKPEDLEPFMDWLADTGLTPDWMVCAFGPGETACLTHAHRLGGKIRVGFENSLWHADGSLATSNADRVRAVRAALSDQTTRK